MRVAVTGGTGFVGTAFLDEAASSGVRIAALTRSPREGHPGVEWVRGDLADSFALDALVNGADVVLHIAGLVNAPDRQGFLEANVRGTERLVDAANKAGVPRLVLVSSLAAREPGLSDYGWSKREGERVVRSSGLDWTIVRPPAVYGPRDTEILPLFRSARLGLVPIPSEGRLSVIHVADLARLLLALLPARPTLSEVSFEPDDGREGGWSHREMAQAIGASLGRRIWCPQVPGALLTGAARFDRAIRGTKAQLTPDRARYMRHPHWVAEPSRLVPENIWKPQIGLLDGLRQTADWYVEQGWLRPKKMGPTKRPGPGSLGEDA